MKRIILTLALAVMLPPAHLSAQTVSGDAWVRIQELEAQLRRLQGKVEQLENQLRRVSDDAARRFGDIEFRLTELEGGDVSLIPDSQPLGQGAPAGPAVAISEQGDLNAAIAKVEAGDLTGGRKALEGFRATYPRSPLNGDAQHWIGESYYRASDFRRAAQAYLSTVSNHAKSSLAPRSMLQLGVTLGRMGLSAESCSTFQELPRRFPNAGTEISEAAAEADRAGCG